MNEINILTEKQPDRTDSFFYAVPIAEATAKDGTVFTSYPSGDVRLTVGETVYDGDRRFSEDGFDELTDYDLSEGDNDGVTWTNNNWFAIMAEKDGESYWDFEMVDFDFDSAVSSLENIVQQYDSGELELQ
jgi:hypothetical protein